MTASIRFLAMALCLCILLSLLPAVSFATKTETEQINLKSDAELTAAAADLKTEIASLADGKNRNGRVSLRDFKPSSDGKTDMIDIKGKHYLVRRQGDGQYYALNGAWTGTDADLPVVKVTASDDQNFYYIASGISTTNAFNLVPAGIASNGMPAYNLQFNNGKYMGIGSQYTGTYTNLFHVKASTSKDKVRFEHNANAGNFGIRNFTGTHGLRQNSSITVYRWKDNSDGKNEYSGNVLYLYRLWSTTDLRAAINEVKSYLDAPVFYDPLTYEKFLTCLRQSIDMFQKYNVVPTNMIQPYDYIQDTLDAQAAKLRAFKNQLKLVIDGLSQAETDADTRIYQLGSQQPRAEGDYDHSMSYIIKTRKGKIIIIDGGWEKDNFDGKYLFSYLCEITGDTTPHVTAWFITHAHGDHHGAVATMANLYADKITVDAFYHHNPSDEEIDKYFTACDGVTTKAATRRVRNMMAKLKNAEGGKVKEVFVNSIHSGMCNSTFDFDEVHIDILLDMSDIAYMADTVTTKYNGSQELHGRTFSNKTLKELLADNLNESSIVFRVTAMGKNVLFTGDAGFVAGKALNLYHSRNEKNPEIYYNLKTDWVQVAHHGYYGMAKDTYQLISPSKALFPTPKWELEENPRVGYAAQWFTDMGATNYFSYAGPQIFKIPAIRTNVAVSIPAELKPYVFDAKYYADNNADLKKAYGYDEAKLYKHFVNFGIEEGRCASPLFDVKFYMNQNGQNFLYGFKGDYEKAFKHFVSNYQSTELKKLSPTFDPSVYVTMHTELKDSTQFALLQHYLVNDYVKGRIATTTYPSADGAMHTSCILTQAKLPTCAEEGRTVRIKCSACSAILEETTTIAKLPHSYDEGVITTEPTCISEGVITYTCIGCSATETSTIAAGGHAVVNDDAVAPNCSQTGLSEGSHCSVCGEILVAQQTIEKLDHTEVTDAALAPTCTTTGLTEGKHCSVCNEILVAQEVIAASGHNYKAVVTDPTCTENGYTTYTCAVCQDTYDSDYAEANGHDYQSVVTHPTCTESGYTTYTCSACGDSYTADEIEASGHSYDEGKVTKEPTCTEEGIKTFSCACGDSYTETIEKRKHETTYYPDKQATCTEDGHGAYYHCKICSGSFFDENCEYPVDINFIKTPAPGHAAVYIPEQAATCTEDGCGAYYHCDVCGSNFFDEAGEYPLDINFIKISAQGHSYTYTDNGEKHTVGCASCDYSELSDHTFVDGSCICGAVEKTEPKMEYVPTLEATMSISVGAEMQVFYTLRSSVLANYTDFYVEVVKNVAGGEPITTIFSVENGNLEPFTNASGKITRYSATYTGIAAKEMGDSFTSTVYAVDAEGNKYYGPSETTSIKEYLTTQIESDSASAQLKTLAVDMLHYGAAAQINFAYDAENLVNADLTEEQNALGTQEDPTADNGFAQSASGCRVNTSVSIGSKVELYLTFIYKPTAESKMELRIKNAKGDVIDTLTPAYTVGANYKAVYDNVGAKQMRELITIELYDNGTLVSKSTTWSVETYVAQVIENSASSVELVNVCKAMLTYGDAAAAYLASSGQ